jgi:hypothetical protein
MIILPANYQLTQKEMQRIHKLEERKRNTYIRKYEKEFRKALSDQTTQALSVVKKMGVVAGMPETASEAITKQPFEKPLNELYNEVAFVNYESTRKGKMTKKDIADVIFFRELSAFVIRTRGLHIKYITETTRSVIKRILGDSVANGLGIEETVRQILLLTNIRDRARARTIARTEVIGAGNYGSQKGAEATGLSLEKVWLTAVDGRERPEHRDANGNRVGLQEPFTVGGQELMYPHAENGTASNVINCRCAVVYKEIE